METKWLEDFVSLAETRSFSRSAQLRHVTQPAFSRRIQALEAWAGADLVDRSSYPTRLTPAGKTMYDQALEMLQALQSTRSMLRAHASSDASMVGFAVPHTLAFTFFPRWVAQVQASFGPFKSRLIALNVHDAVMRKPMAWAMRTMALTMALSASPLSISRTKDWSILSL